MDAFDPMPLYGGNSHGNFDFIGATEEIIPQSYLDSKTVLEKMPDYVSKFQTFYAKNVVLMSVIQWVFILILLIKVSKK